MSLMNRAKADQGRIFATGFVEPVTLELASGETVHTSGIWHEGGELVDTGEYLQVASSKPSIVIQQASLMAKPRIDDDRVQYRGEWYIVADCEPVHPHMWRVSLHKERKDLNDE